MQILKALASLPRLGKILAPASLILGIIVTIATGQPFIGWVVFVASMLLWMVQEIAIDVVAQKEATGSINW